MLLLAVAIVVIICSYRHLTQDRFVNPVLFSLYYTQSRASKHAVSVRGAPTLMMLTFSRLTAAVSPPEIHSVNMLILSFLPVRYGNYHRTIIIHKEEQGEKGGSTNCELCTYNCFIDARSSW